MLRCSKNVELLMTAMMKDRTKSPRSPVKASPAAAKPAPTPAKAETAPAQGSASPRTTAAPIAVKPAPAPATAPIVTMTAPPRAPVAPTIAAAPVTASVAIEPADAPARAPVFADPPETLEPPAAAVASDRAPPTPIPVPTNPQYKENTMATAFGTTKDTVTETVKSTVSQFNESAETAMTNGKAAMEQVTAQAKDAVESSMKSLDEMTEVARGNVEALLASVRVAAAGFETLAAHISEVSRKSFESTTSTARAMASAKTPNEMFQMQSDFAKAQFDSAVSEFSKLTEMMVKMSGEVMEPVQNRVAITTDKMKTAFTK